jgi:hypothetical protein
VEKEMKKNSNRPHHAKLKKSLITQLIIKKFQNLEYIYMPCKIIFTWNWTIRFCFRLFIYLFILVHQNYIKKH